MIRGFELIKTREASYKDIIVAMEEKYQLTLPPLYKLCVSHFELGTYVTENYLSAKYNDLHSLYTPIYAGNEYVEWDFFSIEEVFEHYCSLIGYGDEDVENGFLRIAPVSFGGSIFVGIREDNKDKIILSLWDKFPLYEVLAKNIFEFIQNFHQQPIEEDCMYGVKYSQLYKNWGEDFWRVRE